MDKPSHWVEFFYYIFNPTFGFVHIWPKVRLEQPSNFRVYSHFKASLHPKSYQNHRQIFWRCTSDSLNEQMIWLFLQHIRFIEWANDMVIFTRLLKGYLFPQCQIYFLPWCSSGLTHCRANIFFISKHNPSLRHIEVYWDTQENCEGRLWMRDAKLMRWGGSVWEIQRERNI